ncbi:MAG: hypothetical protein NUV59_01765 [Patescibacteria group bacterium]|nr:hypothetical protein [Patescibacteria group bacterium]
MPQELSSSVSGTMVASESSGGNERMTGNSERQRLIGVIQVTGKGARVVKENGQPLTIRGNDKRGDVPIVDGTRVSFWTDAAGRAAGIREVHTEPSRRIDPPERHKEAN